MTQFKPIKDALNKHVYADGWDSQSVAVEPNEPPRFEIQYERKWVALLTVPNQEKKAFDWLARIGQLSFTEPYWPHYKKHISVGMRRRQALVARSIFPGMMFASIAIGEIRGYKPFEEFENTPGIRSYLRNGQGHTAYISLGDMCLISAIELAQNAPPEPVKVHEFRKGDKVRIIADLVNAWPAGIVDRVNRDGSLSIDIPGLFGQVTRTRLSASEVEAV